MNPLISTDDTHVHGIMLYRRKLGFLLGYPRGSKEMHAYTIAEMENMIVESGLYLPIVRLPQHYYRSNIETAPGRFTRLCACTAAWPCDGD